VREKRQIQGLIWVNDTFTRRVAFHCRDYAAHLRTMAELLRQYELEATVAKTS
jgi:hypothetical protein